MGIEQDVVVVGGGLGGLTVATLLAKQGWNVTVVEKASGLGGRAATQTRAGYCWNLGPHALYRGGDTLRLLTSLGVHVTGGVPSASGNFALSKGKKQMLPGGFFSLVSTGLLGLAAKLELAKVLTGLSAIDPAPWMNVSVSTWVQSVAKHVDAQALLYALIRVSTYTDAPTVQSAGAALVQLQMSVAKNVLYVDGGWTTLVEKLRDIALTLQVNIQTDSRVVGIETDPHQALRHIHIKDGQLLSARAVVIAGSPAMAKTLCPNVPTLATFADEAVPVQAACLDVALRSLPRPSSRFLLGIDQPVYASVHSAYAQLAPTGGATIHLAKYLSPGEKVVPSGARSANSNEAELMHVLELLQPGFRDVLVDHRFMPAMTVAHNMVSATSGGLAGRPSPVVSGAPGLYVVGDWVGGKGMLLDASCASAELAAVEIDKQLRAES